MTLRFDSDPLAARPDSLTWSLLRDLMDEICDYADGDYAPMDAIVAHWKNRLGPVGLTLDAGTVERMMMKCEVMPFCDSTGRGWLPGVALAHRHDDSFPDLNQDEFNITLAIELCAKTLDDVWAWYRSEDYRAVFTTGFRLKRGQTDARAMADDRATPTAAEGGL